jgi:hypothetical protein
VIELLEVTPAAEEGWWLLFELAEDNGEDWLLVGGQMMFLLAAEHHARLPRATVDVDVVVNVRALPGGTQWLSAWLTKRDFEQETPSADGIPTVSAARPILGRAVLSSTYSHRKDSGSGPAFSPCHRGERSKPPARRRHSVAVSWSTSRYPACPTGAGGMDVSGDPTCSGRWSPKQRGDRDSGTAEP